MVGLIPGFFNIQKVYRDENFTCFSSRNIVEARARNNEPSFCTDKKIGEIDPFRGNLKKFINKKKLFDKFFFSLRAKDSPFIYDK